jgi:hypothetical protein
MLTRNITVAIKKKDRSFEELLGDVVWDDVPIDYIEQITISLDGGDSIILKQDDLDGIKNTSELFNTPGLDQLVSRVRNVDVKVDTLKLKNVVHKHVRTLLGRHFSE